MILLGFLASLGIGFYIIIVHSRRNFKRIKWPWLIFAFFIWAINFFRYCIKDFPYLLPAEVPEITESTYLDPQHFFVIEIPKGWLLTRRGTETILQSPERTFIVTLTHLPFVEGFEGIYESEEFINGFLNGLIEGKEFKALIKNKDFVLEKSSWQYKGDGVEFVIVGKMKPENKKGVSQYISRAFMYFLPENRYAFYQFSMETPIESFEQAKPYFQQITDSFAYIGRKLAIGEEKEKHQAGIFVGYLLGTILFMTGPYLFFNFLIVKIKEKGIKGVI